MLKHTMWMTPAYGIPSRAIPQASDGGHVPPREFRGAVQRINLRGGGGEESVLLTLAKTNLIIFGLLIYPIQYNMTLILYLFTA
jgi:hypothetical protein